MNKYFTLLRNYFTLILFFALTACAQSQPKNQDELRINKEKNPMDTYKFEFPSYAHPKAKILLKDEFYWSPIDEDAPFGSDDGSDAFHGFREWRVVNPNESPITFLKQLIARWGYPIFDWNELDSNKIQEYFFKAANVDEEYIQNLMTSSKTALKNEGHTLNDDAAEREIILKVLKTRGITSLIGQDNAIIAVGFGQFVLEGKIDKDIKALAQIAIQRQLLPVLLNRFEPDYQEYRKEKLSDLSKKIEQM